MKNKLSAWEELRAERDKLRTECSALESSIGKNIYYVRHNFGSLLVAGVFNSSQNAICSLFGGGSSSKSFLNGQTHSVLSTVWNIARPFVAGWITKKITAYLFNKR
jgi:predicted alpha/beta hydrolase